MTYEIMNANIKSLSLIGTVWFSVSQSLVIRWFNTLGHNIDANTMVLMTELCKIAIVSTLCRGWLHKSPFPGPVQWGFAVNALLYIGTNLLSYVILESIDVGLYMILIQHKVLLVVGLSSIVLKRSYTRMQWFACVLLMLGIVLAQYRLNGAKQSEHPIRTSILVLVVVQGLCSSFSGVWMEKMMKRDDDLDTEPRDPLYDILTDSLQMYGFSLPFYVALASNSFGTHTLPILPSIFLVINGACCGLCIGSIFKYYSAAVRTFVQGATVILSVWISVVLLNEHLSWGLGFGTVCVVGGIVVFQRGRQP